MTSSMPHSLAPPTGSSPDAEEDTENHPEMGYQQTLMYGRYSKSLGDYAKQEAKRQKVMEKVRR